MQAPLPLGNDIVDLGDTNNKTSAANPLYVKRVLARSELEYLAASGHHAVTFWAMWAAKEAAYKALKKVHPELSFIHRRFIVATGAHLAGKDAVTAASGMVSHERQHIPVTWVWTAEWMHCMTGNDSDTTSYQVRAVSDLRAEAAFVDMKTAGKLSDESIAARLIALSLLAGSGWQNLKIIRPTGELLTGPPQIVQKDNLLPHLDVSLSHDGRYAAAAVCGTSGADSQLLPF